MKPFEHCNAVGAVADVAFRTLDVPGPAGALPARLYRAVDRTAPAPALLVFLHAGGFTSGRLEDVESCMRRLAGRIDIAVLTPGYTQAPDQPFPAAAEDAYAVVVDCAAHPRRYGWSGGALIVGGVEAGGNLAAVAAMMARDRGGPALAGQLLIQPMLDPGLSSPSMRCASERDAGEQIASQCAEAYREYLPRPGDRVHPYACPLASTRLKGLPSTLMVSIDGDPLRDEARTYLGKLEAAGVPVRSLALRVPDDAASLVDATARCRACADDAAFDVMADFIASVGDRPRKSGGRAADPTGR